MSDMTEIDRVLAGLDGVDDRDALTSDAFMDLLRFDETQRRELLQRVDTGLVLPATLAGILAIMDPFKVIADEFWPEDTCFIDDEGFSLTRFIFVFERSGDARAMPKSRWEAGAAQLRRMFTAGHIPSLRGLFFLFWYAAERGDNDFALFFGAHSGLDKQEFASNAFTRSRALMEYALAKWLQIQAERDRLCREVWLRAYVSETEYAAARGLHTDALRGLYPQVWAGGYRGYLRALNGGETDDFSQKPAAGGRRVGRDAAAAAAGESERPTVRVAVLQGAQETVRSAAQPV